MVSRTIANGTASSRPLPYAFVSKARAALARSTLMHHVLKDDGATIHLRNNINSF